MHDEPFVKSFRKNQKFTMDDPPCLWNPGHGILNEKKFWEQFQKCMVNWNLEKMQLMKSLTFLWKRQSLWTNLKIQNFGTIKLPGSKKVDMSRSKFQKVKF